MAKFLIIGAGISGCTAGIELANQGNDVEIIEVSGKIGGKITGYSCKATDNCSRCGVCIAHNQFRESFHHEKIRFTTGASVKSVSQKNGKTELVITRANPNIDHKKCNNCDACLHACPNHCITKYSRADFTQYIIDYAGCLLHQGKECSICADVCPSNGIYTRQKETEIKILSNGVLIAAGHEPYDASKNILYGYSRLPDVITGVEAEEILSRQNYLGKPDGSTAFIQCVGSRNPLIGRNFCSAVCCAYALRIARVLKYRNPTAEITIYYIDIQNFDKTFTLLRKELVDSGIHFVRGLPFKVDKSESGRLKLLLEDVGGHNNTAEYDTVVLSVGIGPGNNAEDLAALFRLEKDEYGFLLPESSTLSNVFVSGTCREPQSIVESIDQSKSEALKMLKTINKQEDFNKATSPGKSEKTVSSMTPSFEVIQIPLDRNVLIIGGGIAAAITASELQSLGYETTLISSKKTMTEEEMPAGVKVLTGSNLIQLNGQLGSFQAKIQSPEGMKNMKFGAIVLASGRGAVKNNPFQQSNFIVTMEELWNTVINLRRKKGVRPIGLILDMNIDETRAGMESALNLGIRLQKRGLRQVHLFCREAKVGGRILEKLYDDARETGVNIIKFEQGISIIEGKYDVSVKYCDSILQNEVCLSCDFVGVSSNGIEAAVDTELPQIAGISTDAYGCMQENNIHLISCKTNRPGIFIAGSCRGSDYMPQIISESKAAALSVHSLLKNGFLEVELSNAVVDPDKCILCLTCIRSCPFKAMQIDKEKGAAQSIPEACQKCGICASECPAKAIELPLYSDQVLLDQINSV